MYKTFLYSVHNTPCNAGHKKKPGKAGLFGGCAQSASGSIAVLVKGRREVGREGFGSTAFDVMAFHHVH